MVGQAGRLEGGDDAVAQAGHEAAVGDAGLVGDPQLLERIGGHGATSS